METMSHFRVKLDLSKIFADHRKTSWIFVDKTKILNIQHLKLHIEKVFDIVEPFHLLCDSIYLPCKEDIRIVQYDNIITLLPRRSVNNTSVSNGFVSIRECPDGHSLKTNLSQISISQASTFDEKEVQTDTENQADSNSPSRDVNMTVLSVITNPETLPNNTMYHSLLEESEVVSAEDSKNDSLMTEDASLDMTTPAKRKRPRRKRVSNRIDSQPESAKSDKIKPRIIEQIVLGSGKHIRFSNQDEEIPSPSSCTENNSQFQSKLNESPLPKSSSSTNLAALLSLKQCSTPLIFSCNKQNKAGKSAIAVVNEDVENQTESDRNIVPNNTSKLGKINGSPFIRIQDIDAATLPLLTSNPQVKDIIAFKMYKMGNDYTPQISNFIYGKVIDFNSSSSLCTIKVMGGKEEIEEPKGKYSLPNDEEENPSDVIKLNINQLLDPRLMYRAA